MQSKLLHTSEDGQRTFAVILDEGDEIAACLKAFARSESLSAAQFSAIGALSRGVISYFDWERKTYIPRPVDEQVEVASLNGDIACAPDGSPAVHAHIVLGRRDGSALAGHLDEGHVRPTLEIILTESPAHLRKRHDAKTGLALIALDA